MQDHLALKLRTQRSAPTGASRLASLLQKSTSAFQTGTSLFFLPSLFLFTVIIMHHHLNSFIQRIFTEYLLYARHCLGPSDTGVDTQIKVSTLMDFIFQRRGDDKIGKTWACLCMRLVKAMEESKGGTPLGRHGYKCV